MTFDDINNLDFKNMGSWPAMAKLVLLLLLFVVVLILGYLALLRPAMDDLEQAEAKEKNLKQVFLAKKNKAVKIDAYREQMVEVEKTFGALLKQLPDKSEMDGLLSDINQAGLGRGLEFDLFKPGREAIIDFYAELPIQIQVQGDYFDLGAFATDVSKLARIVTLNDIKIAHAEESKDGRLMMEAVAKTFRYLDAEEIAAKNAEAEKAKAQ